MENLKRLVCPLILGLSLVLAVGASASQATPQSVNSGQHFLPPYASARDRFGFDSGSLSGYDVPLLNAGWYSNWGASVTPPHPGQLVYVQLVRFGAGSDPYDPGQVKFSPGKATIAKIAAANPGSLWLLANEPDSVYQGAPIYPDVYAVAYHNLYAYIKGLDPSALIANGGIVQPTPCRLAYLDIVWDTYLATFGEPLPVDVWNIHAFVLREVYNSWGASTPPGVNRNCAMDYTVEQADDMDIFLANLKAMRAWMKDKGYQDKPLIISEYGILWPEWWAAQFTPQRVSQFMTRSFDLFLDETDAEIGYPADDYRLVQAWAWYSLSDKYYNGYLFDDDNDKAISAMGQTYADYTAALSDTPRTDLSAYLASAWSTFASVSEGDGLSRSLTISVSLAGYIGNLGKLPADDVLARLEVLGEYGTVLLLSHDTFYNVPARFEGLVALRPFTVTLTTPGTGRYKLRLSLDPENHVDELREWNNVATTTLDLWPDLTPLSLNYQFTGAAPYSRTMVLTTSIANRGSWPSPAVSATVHLETAPEGAPVASQTMSLPALMVDEQIDLVTSFPVVSGSYSLRAVVDPGNMITELNKENNLIAATLDVWPDLLPLDLDYQISLQPGTGGISVRLAMTNTVRNQGPWRSQTTSAAVYLETVAEATLVVSQSLPLPALAPDTQADLTTTLSWSGVDYDLYHLRIVLDEDGLILEQDKVNNQRTWTIPITMSARLVPTETTVLDSLSGEVRIIFPAGAVITPVVVIYTPFWPASQVPPTLRPSRIGFELTSLPNGLLTFEPPIAVNWNYGDGGTVGLDAPQLRLFMQKANDDWPDAACQDYQKDLGQGQVTAFICQTGKFAFGNRYDVYLPLALKGFGAPAVQKSRIRLPVP